LEVFVGKIIFALIIAAIAWVLFKGLTKKPPGGSNDANAGNATKARPTKSSPGTPPNLNAPERMVKCVRCGVFMPETDSLIIDGKLSCLDPNACGHANERGHS
jgi:hypothetical protein